MTQLFTYVQLVCPDACFAWIARLAGEDSRAKPDVIQQLEDFTVLLRLGWRGQHSPSHTEDHKPNVMQSLKTTSRRHVLAQPDLCSEDGFNQGKISGTIRGYTGAKSAQKQFGDNPKWIVRYGNERTLYDKAHAPDYLRNSVAMKPILQNSPQNRFTSVP